MAGTIAATGSQAAQTLIFIIEPTNDGNNSGQIQFVLLEKYSLKNFGYTLYVKPIQNDSSVQSDSMVTLHFVNHYQHMYLIITGTYYY